jgi:Erg28 like protein
MSGEGGEEYEWKRLTLQYDSTLFVVTPLSARLFGVWNILSAVIRVKCAYELKNERYVGFNRLKYLD